MRVRNIIITLYLIVFSGVFAQADSVDGVPSLRESYDPGLQSQLQSTVTRLGLERLVADRKLSVALVDITNLDDPRVAEVNGDEMIYAASLPKIAILLGAFVEIERGKIDLDGATRHSLTQMIRVSSNREATRMLNRVGKSRLINILRSERFRLYDPAVNGGLWVGKEYGKAPAYRRDPIHNLSHAATALQTARFYYMLETNQLVAPHLSREMKAMLGNPGIKHKFVKALANRPGTRIFRKSGSWRQWHADSAIVESGHHRYIIVALAEHMRGGAILEQLARSLHDVVVPRQYVSLRLSPSLTIPGR